MPGMRTKIDCCYKCTRPWKSPYCHIPGNCPDYTGQRAQLDETNKVIKKEVYVAAWVQEQKYDRIAKAMKKRRI